MLPEPHGKYYGMIKEIKTSILKTKTNTAAGRRGWTQPELC